MAWVVADRCDGADGVYLTLSEEATGISVKNLAWPASFPTLADVAGVALELLGVRLEYATTATAGDRRPVLEIRDSASDLSLLPLSASVVPQSDARIFEMTAGYQPLTAAVELAGTVVRSALPAGLLLQPGTLVTVIQDPLIDLDDTVVVHVRARVID